MKILYETEGQFSSLGGVRFKTPLAVIKHLAGRNALMAEAARIVYAAEEIWFDSQGEGTWPALAPDTVTRKAQQGAAEPSRPLYHRGNLRGSVISPSGPYSFILPIEDGIIFGVNWAVRGYQVADVLSRGAPRQKYSAFKGLPARPLWPQAHTPLGMELTQQIGQLFLTGSSTRLGRRRPASGA